MYSCILVLLDTAPRVLQQSAFRNTWLYTKLVYMYYMYSWGGHSHKDREEQAQLKKRRFGTPWRSFAILDETTRRDQKWAPLAELFQKHERASSLLE